MGSTTSNKDKGTVMTVSASELRTILPDGVLIAIREVGRELMAVRADTGEDVTNYIRRWTRKKAADAKCGLRIKHTKTGMIQFRQISSGDIAQEMRLRGTTKLQPAVSSSVAPTPVAVAPSSGAEWAPMSDADITMFLSRALEFKPIRLVISEIKWKYLCRSALRGKNILMVGPSGCGKTLACQSVHETFPDRKWFYFNLGASQDPRGMLIGNTHFDKESGTFFSKALFVEAIQTPGAIILLDEVSRAHDDAANILMTVLDENQHYLRIDERPDTPTVPVAPGVVFLGTANIGNEYTGARVMDRALLDRFIIIEMTALEKADELKVLEMACPNVDVKMRESIADIAVQTRADVLSDDPKVSTIISTRMSVEIANLLNDGFTLAEAAEVCIYPFYSPAGGADSERTYMKQLVQKHLPTEFDNKDKPWENADDSKVPWEA